LFVLLGVAYRRPETAAARLRTAFAGYTFETRIVIDTLGE